MQSRKPTAILIALFASLALLLTGCAKESTVERPSPSFNFQEKVAFENADDGWIHYVRILYDI